MCRIRRSLITGHSSTMKDMGLRTVMIQMLVAAKFLARGET